MFGTQGRTRRERMGEDRKVQEEWVGEGKEKKVFNGQEHCIRMNNLWMGVSFERKLFSSQELEDEIFCSLKQKHMSEVTSSKMATKLWASTLGCWWVSSHVLLFLALLIWIRSEHWQLVGAYVFIVYSGYLQAHWMEVRNLSHQNNKSTKRKHMDSYVCYDFPITQFPILSHQHNLIC